MATKLLDAVICCCLLLSAVACSVMHSTSTSAPMITSANPPDGTVGSNYGGGQGFSFAAQGGTPPYTWSWTGASSSSVPPGLSLSAQTGQISGRPTMPGVFPV